MPAESKVETDALHMHTATTESLLHSQLLGLPWQCDKPQSKQLDYNGWLEYEVQETWTTWQDATLERADIDHQTLQRMAKFLTNSLLFKTPYHKPKKTDIHLWKLYSKGIL
jgi:hypothetical protein